jgi:hypothetical protein
MDTPTKDTPIESLQEKPDELHNVSDSGIEDADEVSPHLHAKTFLTVFAVCLIYFAQLINVVGAGAVSPSSLHSF